MHFSLGLALSLVCDTRGMCTEWHLSKSATDAMQELQKLSEGANLISQQFVHI